MSNAYRLGIRRLRQLSPLLALALLAILPTRLLDDLPSLCPYRNLFGFRCLGCGMTHAISSLLHFHAVAALSWNPLVVIAFPGLVFWAARGLRNLLRSSQAPAEAK